MVNIRYTMDVFLVFVYVTGWILYELVMSHILDN